MTTPAGWYPDPADPSRTRWWDGAQWSEHTAGGATPVAPAAPAAPAAPVVPAVPRYGEYAPSAPSASDLPVAPAAPGYSAYPTAPAWPAAAPVVHAGPSAPGVGTDTLWVYLVIAVTTLPVFGLFLVDWTEYLTWAVELDSGSTDLSGMTQWFATIAVFTLFSYLLMGLSILFSWLDWREIKKRGVARPFHWAYAFFVLLIGFPIVYIIGRTVVVKRETGKGLTAMWVWVAATVLAFVVGVVWFFALMQEVVNSIPLS